MTDFILIQMVIHSPKEKGTLTSKRSIMHWVNKCLIMLGKVIIAVFSPMGKLVVASPTLW
jgi:hypothetical protein